jgi:hypothetical protein
MMPTQRGKFAEQALPDLTNGSARGKLPRKFSDPRTLPQGREEFQSKLVHWFIIRDDL